MHMSRVFFSTIEHLYDSKSNRSMSTELIATELTIRLNSALLCADVNGFLLFKPELLKFIHSNEKIVLRNNM